MTQIVERESIVEPEPDGRRKSAGQRTPAAGENHRPPVPWPALATLLASAIVLDLVLLGGSGALRAVSVLGYVTVVPGLAWARLIPNLDGLGRFVVGVGFSLALGVLVAQGMIHLHLWSPLLGLFTLSTIASLAALIELVRYGLRRSREQGVGPR